MYTSWHYTQREPPTSASHMLRLKLPSPPLTLFVLCTCAHKCRCPERPEEGFRFSGAGVTGYFEQLKWMLGTELGSFARAALALNY